MSVGTCESMTYSRDGGAPAFGISYETAFDYIVHPKECQAGDFVGWTALGTDVFRWTLTALDALSADPAAVPLVDIKSDDASPQVIVDQLDPAAVHIYLTAANTTQSPADYRWRLLLKRQGQTDWTEILGGTIAIRV